MNQGTLQTWSPYRAASRETKLKIGRFHLFFSVFKIYSKTIFFYDLLYCIQLILTKVQVPTKPELTVEFRDPSIIFVKSHRWHQDVIWPKVLQCSRSSPTIQL